MQNISDLWLLSHWLKTQSEVMFLNLISNWQDDILISQNRTVNHLQ